MEITETREVVLARVDWNDEGRVEVEVFERDMTPESAVALAAAITVAHAEATQSVTEMQLRMKLDGLTAADRVEASFPCAWCDRPSRGGAYQFDDDTYPQRSCGEHGSNFVADEVTR